MSMRYMVTFVSNDSGLKSFGIKKSIVTILSVIPAAIITVAVLYLGYLSYDASRIESRLEKASRILEDKKQRTRMLVACLNTFTSRTANTLIQWSEELPVENNIVHLISADHTHKTFNNAPSIALTDYSLKIIDDLSMLSNDLTRNSMAYQRYKRHKAAIPDGIPLEGVLISGFGLRDSPFYKVKQIHRGIDIVADLNTAVRVTGDGTVAAAGFDRLWGKNILVDHGFGIKTQYGHLNEILVNVGEAVKKGDTVGKLGQTGRATGPHIHYQIWVNNIPRDPLSIIDSSEARKLSVIPEKKIASTVEEEKGEKSHSP
ncbi:M23 family metallopeptidase [candidate division KSB1 bacterium]